MKPVQVLIDEPLLAPLDADEEVRRDGRSAVLRRAIREYLRRRRRQIDRAPIPRGLRRWQRAWR
ncbi:MAG: ribbon-helix-helix protein, CopG family [Vicinamibacteria bacterium]